MNKNIILAFLFLTMIIGGGYTLYKNVYTKNFSHPYPSADIRTCNTDIDKTFIKKQFKENWIYLISSPDYDINYFIEKKGIYPYQPQYEGKMQIKMLYVDNMPVGFIGYYMKNDLEGSILFVDIDKEHRGKRYAESLVKYAIADFASMGAEYVTLGTQKTNTSAQKLYERLGYKKVDTVGSFVEYRILLR